MFSAAFNCKTVLLADKSSYDGDYTIVANPLQDPTTGAISITSVRIFYKGTTYFIGEGVLRVAKIYLKKVFFNELISFL